MTKEDRNRADARFNKAAHEANEAKNSKAERDAALKAVTDNMAKLKALRLAREAAEPPRPAATLQEGARAKSKNQEKRARRCPIGWRTSKVAGAGLNPAERLQRKRRSIHRTTAQTGAGHSIIERVLVAAS